MEKENYIFEPYFQIMLLDALDYPPAKNVENLIRKYIEAYKIIAVYIKNPTHEFMLGGFSFKHGKILINISVLNAKIGKANHIIYSEEQLKDVSKILVHEMIHLIFFRLPKETFEVTKQVLEKFYKTLCYAFTGMEGGKLNQFVNEYINVLIIKDTKKLEPFLEYLLINSPSTKFASKKTKSVFLKVFEFYAKKQTSKLKSYISSNLTEYFKGQEIFKMAYETAYGGFPKRQTFLQELVTIDEVLSSSASINTPQAIKTYANIFKLVPKIVEQTK
jgi:hypothetical protein